MCLLGLFEALKLLCCAGCEWLRVCYVCTEQAASEDELRVNLGLVNYTTGKGKVALTETGMRPIEVFMCSVVRSLPFSVLASIWLLHGFSSDVGNLLMDH